MGGLRRLAVLSAASEAETVFGGRALSWTPVGSLWVALGPVGAKEAAGAAPADRPRLVQSAEAEARDHPGAARGQILSVDGQDWRVVTLDRGRPRPGRMILMLERDAP